MTDWIKLSATLAHHPKILAAGGDATLLYVVLLAMNGRLERDGHLRALETSEPALLHEMHFAGWDLDRLQAALAAAESAGLVERSDSGLSIAGWDDAWRPSMTAAERQRKHREMQAKRTVTPRHGAVTPPRDKPSQPRDVTSSSRPVTPPSRRRNATVTPVTPKKERKKEYVHHHSELSTRTSTGDDAATATLDQTAPDGAGGGGGGDPEPETRSGTPETGNPLIGPLSGLGIGALQGGECFAMAAALHAAGIEPADVARLDAAARRAGQDHDGGDGRGLLLAWLRDPQRARKAIAEADRRNPPAINGAGLTAEQRAADAAKAEAAAEARRDRLRELATALDDLELDDGIPARRHAERLDDAGLGLDELARLDGLARQTNAAGETDPDDDPDGRGLLSHWLRDPRLARMALDGGR